MSFLIKCKDCNGISEANFTNGEILCHECKSNETIEISENCIDCEQEINPVELYEFPIELASTPLCTSCMKKYGFTPHRYADYALKSYNNWPNFSTWKIFTLVSNDEYLYNLAGECKNWPELAYLVYNYGVSNLDLQLADMKEIFDSLI